MSFFGKKDANLPLLTQFYQLEPVHFDNVYNYRDLTAEQVSALAESEIGQWYAQQQKISDLRALLAKVNTNSYQEPPLQTLFDVADVHDSTRLALDSVADTGTITVELLNNLEFYFFNRLRPSFCVKARLGDPHYKTFFEYPDIVGADGTVQAEVNLLAEEAVLRIDDLSIMIFRYGDCFTQILRQLQAVLLRQEYVARCAECRSVFIVTRKGREYCSFRCANRVMARRSRARRASAAVEPLSKVTR